MKKLCFFLVMVTFSGLNEAFGQWNTSGSNIYNSNTGYVGIGDPSPTTLLHVAKNMTEPAITVQNLGGIGGATYIMMDNVSGANWKFKATNSGGFKIRDHAASLDVFVIEPNSSANAIYINGAGNVGIGTGNPGSKLHVEGGDALVNGLTVGRGAGNLQTNSALGYRSLYSNSSGFNNTAAGDHALNENLTGSNNTAVGFNSLYNNNNGYSNVGVGTGSLYLNSTRSNLVAVGDSAMYHNGSGASGSQQGNWNTAVGSKALYTNAIGFSNTAVGHEALYANTLGDRIVAIGNRSLDDNTSGDDNVAVGSQALGSNTTGSYNVAVGSNAMPYNVTGERNIGIGYNALYNNEVSDNIGIGRQVLEFNSHSAQNIAIGTSALHAVYYANGNVSYDANNIAIGYEALYNTNPTTSSTGINNNAVGYNSLHSNTNGYGNTAVGHSTISAGTTGDYNTAVGFVALNDLVTGSNNTAVGYNAGPSGSYPGVSNSTALGNNTAVTASDQVRIGNSSVGSIGGYQDWSNISDGRFKEEVKADVPGLDFIRQLHPVTYRLNRQMADDFTGISAKKERLSHEYASSEEYHDAPRLTELRTGFIAQEVEAAARNIGYDFSGIDAPKNDRDIYGLRYAAFVVPLVKAVQEQQGIIEGQQKQIDELMKRIEKLEGVD